MRLEPTRTAAEIERLRASLHGRRVVVIGAGRSGRASLRELARTGAKLRLADMKHRDELPEAVAETDGLGAEFVANFEAFEQIADADLIIPSPGVPLDHPALVEARERGIEVWGTLELGYRLCPALILAVTGTNGKGTTCRLLAAMLERAGIEHIVAGNIGRPLVGEIDRATDRTPAVVEVSSFQLETIVDFRPRVAALLNISADHLDRHPTIAEYREIKARVFANQRPEDFAVVNADDEGARRLSETSSATALYVSLTSDTLEGAVIGGDLTVRLWGETERICSVDDLALRGEHHHTNALVAAVMARLAGAPADAIARAIAAYEPPRHHMEMVAEIDEVEFINDSKASNPEAAAADLSAMDRPFVAIVGGKDKGGDYSELGRVLTERARAVIAIGEAAGRIATEVGDRRTVEPADTLSDAVNRAAELARPGWTVILAPACSSFDMFDDYRHRGDAFVEAVERLREE